MSCFLYPKKVLQRLDSIVSKFWWKGEEGKRKINWVSVNKMQKKKSEGGLGFKDFEAFNLVLLAKIGWRILKYPEQIWVKILKARYFPRCSFLEAHKGGSASWLWASIVEGRAVLENNVILSIGNGLNTRVWEDPWLGDIPGNKLISPCPHETFKELRVASLLRGGDWNLLSIEGWITGMEREAINNTLVAYGNREDRWVWKGGRRSVYSVKEGYECAKRNVLKREENMPSSSNNLGKTVWKEIWKLKTPPKIKNFMWRLLSNALPSLQNLCRRKCFASELCLICKEKTESVEHLFLFCEWVKFTWFGSSFSFRMEENVNTDMNHWISSWLCNRDFSPWQKALLAMTLWQIWKARNGFLFENSKIDPIFVFSQASSILQEFWEVKGWRMNEAVEAEQEVKQQKENVTWQKPAGNGIKINTDCAWSESDSKAAVAFVVRDSNGWLLDGNVRIVNAGSVLMAESIAFLDAVHYVCENQIYDVQIESDNQDLISCIQKEIPPNDWRCINILDNIQNSRKLIGNHSCNWISRKANLVADWVEGVALGGSCPNDWVSRPPKYLKRLLEKDLRSALRAPD